MIPGIFKHLASALPIAKPKIGSDFLWPLTILAGT